LGTKFLYQSIEMLGHMRDVILQQKIERIGDVHLPSMHFPVASLMLN